MAPNEKERYANAANKHIVAILDRLYKFEHEADAIKKLETLKKIFTTSNQTVDDTPKPCLVLWIKDYELTDEELQQGYMGNFAFITIEAMANGIYTLGATKLETELKYHPRRKRQTGEAMPNWGHPILRGVKKQQTYPTLEAVEKEFSQLHNEYPHTTVPARDKLYIMIYSRAEDSKKPVKRYVLTIEPTKEGGFYIGYKTNNFERKTEPDKADDNAPTPPPQGYFTAMLKLNRLKKGN